MCASNDLGHETICKLNLQAMVTTMQPNLDLTGVSTPVGVLLILPQRKHLSRIAHWKGNVKKYKGGTVVHKKKAFRGISGTEVHLSMTYP